MKAWHFLGNNCRTRYAYPVRVHVGQTLTYDGELVLCAQGLHASVRAIDALQYAPGSVVCHVELGGHVVKGEDKIVATKRTCLAMGRADKALRYFARWCALSVIDLWDAPDLVLDCLMDESDKRRESALRVVNYISGSAAYSAYQALTGALPGPLAAARNAAWSAARARDYASGHIGAWSWERTKQNEELEQLLSECLER